MNGYKDELNDLARYTRCKDVEEDVSFDSSLFNSLFCSLNEQKDADKIIIEICNTAELVIFKNIDDDEMLNEMFNYFSEKEFPALLCQVLMSCNDEIIEAALSLIVNLFSVENDNQIYYSDNFNSEMIHSIFSLIKDGKNSKVCFMALRNIFFKRRDLFNSCDIEELVNLIKENLSEDALMLSVTIIRLNASFTELFVHLFIDSLKTFQKEALIGLFFSVKNDKKLADIIYQTGLLNSEEYKENIDYFSLLIKEVCINASQENKDEIFNSLDWSILNNEAIEGIITHCPLQVKMINEEVIQDLFTAASEGTYLERKKAILTLNYLVKNGATFVHDFVNIALDSIESFEGLVISEVLTTLTDIVVREDDSVANLLGVLNEYRDYFSELCENDDPNIQNNASELLSAIDDRITELEL